MHGAVGRVIFGRGGARINGGKESIYIPLSLISMC